MFDCAGANGGIRLDECLAGGGIEAQKKRGRGKGQNLDPERKGAFGGHKLNVGCWRTSTAPFDYNLLQKGLECKGKN